MLTGGLKMVINADGDLNERSMSYLLMLPVEVLAEITHLLAIPHFIALGQSSKYLYQFMTAYDLYWFNELIKVGCNAEALRELKHTSDITNYKSLYAIFISLNKLDKKKIERSWELICLSGNLEAIQKAISRNELTSLSLSRHHLNALHYAVASGNMQAIKLIEEALPELSHADITKHGNHTLIYAAGSGNVQVIKYCAEKIQNEINKKCFELTNKYYGNNNSFNPLHAAAYAGHIQAVNYLHEALRIPYQAIDMERMTLLHYAASGGHIAMMRYVSEMPNINANGKDQPGALPIHLAAEGGHLQACLMALHEFKNDPNQTVYFSKTHTRRNFNRYNAFQFAVYSGNLSLIAILFKRLSHNVIEETMRKSFYIAAIMGNCRVLSTLIDLASQKGIRLPADLLHHAAYGNNELMTKFLVSVIGFIPLETNEGGETILHFAVRSNNVAAMKYAYEAGVDPKLRNSKGYDMLSLAIKRGNIEAAKLAVNWGCDVNQVLQANSTLIHAAASCNNQEIIKLLIDEGVDVYAVNANGNNALQIALCNKSYEAALYLRCLGVSPLHVNYQGVNALQLASQLKDKELLSYLKTSDFSSLIHVIKNGFLAAVKEAYELSNLIPKSQRQMNVNSALCIAAYYRKNHVIDFLMKSGANINATLNGLTALHYAAIAGDVAIMEQLIAYRIDIQSSVQLSSHSSLVEQLVEGDNILHCAVKALKIATIKYILKLNINFTTPNSEGETPLDIAKSLGVKGRGIVIMIESLLAYSRQNRSLLFIRSAVVEDSAAEIKSNNCISNPQ